MLTEMVSTATDGTLVARPVGSGSEAVTSARQQTFEAAGL
jgi:hypothetical protein